MKTSSSYLRHWLVLSALPTMLWLAAPAGAQNVHQNDNWVQDRDSDGGNLDGRRAAVASFDRFLDDHQEIAEQVRKNPSLLNDRHFVSTHPALQAYLRDHAAVTQQITENPNAFMEQENHYDRRGGFDAQRGSDARHPDADARRSGDLDARRGAVAEFDRYLDDHPQIAQQVRRDPSLLTNQEYLNNNPTLKAQIQDHPQVQQEITENPNAFMQAEARYDRPGQGGDFDARGSGDADARRGGDFDTRRGAVAEFDRYLDDHPQIAEQVRRDPSLLTNQEYLNNNPTLKAQIQDHPQVQQEITQNPNSFMQAEARYDRRGEGGDFDARRGGDVDGQRAAVANFDRFLDDHQEIAEQVRKNPSLLDSHQFVANHPALQAYLQDHPTVTQQITSNPSVFMHQENAYDQRENGMDRDGMRRQTADFGEFLGRHSNISQQLSNNPDLVKHKEYLASRPELQEYLNAHPDVQQALTQDPGSFVRSAQQYGSSTPTVKPSGTPTTPATPTTKTTVPKF